MKEKLWRAAFAQTLPVLAGYLFLGFAYGVLMCRAGFSTLWAVGLSLFIYAGSMQYAAVPVLTGAFDPIGAFLPVSYTHLDVYKRQVWVFSMLLGACAGRMAELIVSAQSGLLFRIKQFFLSIGALHEWHWALIWLAGALALAGVVWLLLRRAPVK